MKITASDRTAPLRLAHSLPKGSEERRNILAGFKTSGYDKGVWNSVPAKAQGPILEHLGRPRERRWTQGFEGPGRGGYDLVPYYTGSPRKAFRATRRPLKVSGHTFTFGADGGEQVVQWDSPSGHTGYFLPPMP